MINSFSSDLELWDAIKEDDIKAFNCFVERHWERVYTTVFWVTRDKSVCMEIVNDIFLQLWLKRKQISIVFFKTYLTTSARYHVYRYIKNSKRHAIKYLEDSGDLSYLSVDNSSDAGILYSELEQEVESSLKVLPKRCKEIFTLSRKQHLSNDEIAKLLDISKRTVENQLTYALHYLRIALKSILLILISLTF